MEVTTNPLRQRVYSIISIGKKDDRVSRIVDIFLITLISLNVLSVILETLPSLKETYKTFFFTFEFVSMIIFSVEYVARIWSAVESETEKYQHPFWGRLRYMMTPLALLDLIVILPFYLGIFLTVDLRFMRILRLLRIFKLTRYSTSITLLVEVLAKEIWTIGAALFVVCMIIIMAASFTFLAEHQVQPEVFSSIPASMWWAVITMTSVGYGDIVPMTTVGKVFAAIISIFSIGLVALPAGLLASSFSEAIHQRRAQYTLLVEETLQDGIVTDDEKQALNKLRESLGIDEDEAQRILQEKRSLKLDHEVAIEHQDTDHDHCCPHCGKSTLEKVDNSTE